LAIPILPFKSNFKTVDKGKFYLGEDFAYNLFINMEKNAIFFARGDMPSFAAYYWKYVKGERQDITIIPSSLRGWAREWLHEREPSLWDTDSKSFSLIIRDIIQDNIDKRPIYFAGIPDAVMIELGLADNPFVLSPRGLISQVERDFDPKENEDFWTRMLWQDSTNIDDYRDWYSKELFEQYVVGSYNSFLHYQRRGYYDLAQKELARLIQIDPYHPDVARAMMKYRLEGAKERKVKPVILRSSQDYLELGYEYFRKNKPGEAMAEFWMAKELDPKNTLPRFQLAKTYELLGLYEEALEEYQEILEIDFNHQGAKDRIMVVEEKMKW
jgi:tetratricopeptide (TPR) repeat protein